MPKPAAPSADFNDYDAIASAVAETERGRWFLAEHARRCRQAETAEVLAAIAALQAALLPHTTVRGTPEAVAPVASTEASQTVAPAAKRQPKAAPPPSRLTPQQSFAEMDALSLQERLRLFR